MAATDPIRKIREVDHAVPFNLALAQTLRDLATLTPSLDAPIISLTLDWRPAGEAPGRDPAPEVRRSEHRSAAHGSGPSWRPSWAEMDRHLTALADSLGPRGEASDSVTADIALIRDYLDQELDPAAKGVAVYACAAANVFVPLALGLPVPTRLTAGPTPALATLTRLREDNPTYAVLVADQQTAYLSLIDQAVVDLSVTVEGSGYPRKQMQGGPSQRRFQARAEERVEAFARGVAEEVLRTLEDNAVSMLIVAGDEVITSALNAVFDHRVKDRIIATIRLEIDASTQKVLEATLPIAAQAERNHEDADVQTLRDAVGAGGRGAAGAEDALTALQAGQVLTLILNDDFTSPGWADYSLPLYGVGEAPQEHPAGGDVSRIVPIVLEEEMIRLALATGAEVQIVHATQPVEVAEDGPFPKAGIPAPRTAAGEALDALGGVGAILRFTLDQDQPVATM
ncbi:MAG: Vms1/Ankzf1 family peptidyl-tRNA hydrolase [Thermomicrobiales bacterium]